LVAERLDRLVFSGANDLVVDTASTTEYGFGPQPKIFKFREDKHVYHTIYFRQKDTLDFVRTDVGIKSC
jgi:hypothetical protein